MVGEPAPMWSTILFVWFGCGKTIELDEDPDISDGAEIEVTVGAGKPRRPWGESIKRSAGALAGSWTEEDNRILEQICQERKASSQLGK